MDKLNYSGQTPFNEHHCYTRVLIYRSTKCTRIHPLFTWDGRVMYRLNVNRAWKTTTLILDKKGNIRFREMGFEGEKLLQSLDAMIEYLKELEH